MLNSNKALKIKPPVHGLSVLDANFEIWGKNIE